MAKLIAGGIEITALHNHLLRNAPHTMHMHIGGRGDPAQLAKVLHDALALSGTPLSAPTAASPAAPEKIDLDTAALDRIMGHKGKRSEEHTSELQSLMRISYAVFCLNKKKTPTTDKYQ